MSKKLLRKIEEFENKRSSLLNEIASLDEEKLNARPIGGKWSVLEIIEHLVIAEREVLGGLKDYEILENRQQSFKNGIMYRLVMFVLKVGIPVKVPSKKMLPKNKLSFEDLRKKWDENQEWFRGYLERSDEEGLKKAVFEHPVSGPINVEQAIEMSIAHIDNHTGQIKKRLDLMS